MIPDKDYYADKDGKLTDDPEKYAIQVAVAGCFLDDRAAMRYGISDALVSVAEPAAVRRVKKIETEPAEAEEVENVQAEPEPEPEKAEAPAEKATPEKKAAAKKGAKKK